MNQYPIITRDVKETGHGPAGSGVPDIAWTCRGGGHDGASASPHALLPGPLPPARRVLTAGLAAIALILLPGMALAHEPDPDAGHDFTVLLMAWIACTFFMLANHWGQYLLAFLVTLMTVLVAIEPSIERARAARAGTSPTPPGIEAPVEGTR